MSILLVDEPIPPLESLKLHIERATEWPVSQASTLAEGLAILLAARQRVQIAVFTINGEHDHALRFIGTVNRLGATGQIARPFFLALSSTTQRPDFAARLDKLGIQLLLRKYPEQIVEALRTLQWQARSARSLPTIVIERRGGYIIGLRVRHQGAAERLHVGPRLGALAGYLVVHAKTEHSTDILADALAISRQSVKEYLLRLRSAFNRVRAKLGTSLWGKDVFWTKRTPGGYVHGLKANAEIEDSEEFFFDEEVDDDAATPRCTVCKTRKPRGESTQSHFGWLCLECCEHLQGKGEL